MDRVIAISITTAFFILLDVYLYQAVKTVLKKHWYKYRKIFSRIFWTFTVVSVALLWLYNFGIPNIVPNGWRTVIMVFLFMNYFSKTIGILFMLIDDLVRLVKMGIQKLRSSNQTVPESAENASEKISRSEFLSRSALIATSIPMFSMSFGIISGAHDYRIRRRKLPIKDLPSALKGLKIAQLSDIHSGSFFNKRAVTGGIDMLLGEKPDVIFFTGDLVNYRASEVDDYFDIFKKLDAPLGTYSILGNHDYGDYYRWPSVEARNKNLNDLKEAHRLMGWNLLLNENQQLEIDQEKIAIIGVENWGAGRFSKYGDLAKAYQGTQDAPVKLLLSHDPSHWDAQVRPSFPDINATFSGHTHGFQFGVEIGDFKWSPSQYIYKQWADLYQEGDQFLYVNRGFGYIGYPGRIGILPEITILELTKA